MSILIRSSALALVVSAGWALPAQASAASDASDAAIQQELAAMRAEMQAMAARIDILEGQLVDARAQAAAAQSKADTASVAVAAIPQQAAVAATATAKPATEITWEGAPKLTTSDGWSFKPRGRLHIDAGTISTPGAYDATRNLGSNVRLRRVRLGFEGTMPGGFGYKAEADFANGSIAVGDFFVSYAPHKSTMQVRIGNFESLDGLEQISSSNNNSFLERAAFNDAFINTRRLGAAVAWRSKDYDWRAELGAFAAHGLDSSLDNNGWIGAGRLVYAPKALGGQLHFGLNYQYRRFAENAGGVASSGIGMPSTNQLARYRARPNSQLTDIRFVDTGNFAARSDQILGVELAGIFKRLYVAGEAQWLRANAYSAGDLASGQNSFTAGNTAIVPTGNPGFFGAYGEVGYFLTGETRGYKRGDGSWSRTKVLNPISKGGSGAFQLAARFEYLDLADDSLIAGPTNNFTTGTAGLASPGSRLGRGGTQTSYLLGLNWYPMDYLRLMINYVRIEVQGGPVAALVSPLSTSPINQQDYGVNVLQTRLQFEF